MTEPRWWHRPYRTFQTNLREIDAGLDHVDVVRRIRELGADTWLLNTAGIVSFYPSRLPFQHPSPYLAERASGDLVGDAVEEAHRNRVRVVSRVDLSKVHRDVAEAHPDWCFAGADGEPQVFSGLHSTCPSGPYYQERSFDILGEVLDRYPIDGFFFNWFNFNQRDYAGRARGICQCVSCRRRFRDRCGMTLPVAEDWDDPAYRRWREYTAATLEELAGRIRTFIDDRAPDTALILRQDPDVVFHEVNNAVDRPQPLWVHWAGEFGRETRTARPDTPAMVNSVLFLDLPYRFQAEQPGLIRLHLAQTMSQGVNPCAYIIGTPDRFDRAALAAVGDMLRFHRDHSRLYQGLRSAARVAIVASPRSQDRWGADGAARVERERRGVYRALLEAHIPFDVLPDALLASRDLSPYDALVLPTVAVLDDAQLAALDAYVEAGGGLVATHEAGAYDAEGRERSEVPLRGLGAARVLHRADGPGAMRSAYLRVTRPEDLPGSEAGAMVAIDRAFLHLELREGAEPSLALVPPSRYGPPEKCYWDLETDHPGLVHHRLGQGRTAYLPWPVGALYFDWSLPEHRALLAQAVRSVSRRPQPVETDAPPCVEVVVSRQPGTPRTLIHLINYSGHRGRAFDAALPLHRIRLDLDVGQVTEARSLRLGEALPLTPTGTRVALELPRLDDFDLIVLE